MWNHVEQRIVPLCPSHVKQYLITESVSGYQACFVWSADWVDFVTVGNLTFIQIAFKYTVPTSQTTTRLSYKNQPVSAV